jgi:hypothetical protein
MLAVLSLAVATATIAAAASQGEWRYFGGDKAFTRYSALDQINRDNVRTLRIAWRRPAVNARLIAAFPDTRANAYLRATPIVVDGVLFTQDAHGLVMALDGATGQTIWEQPFGSAREDALGASTRAGSTTGAAARAMPTGESSRFVASISTPSMRRPGGRCRRLEPMGGCPCGSPIVSRSPDASTTAPGPSWSATSSS